MIKSTPKIGMSIELKKLLIKLLRNEMLNIDPTTPEQFDREEFLQKQIDFIKQIETRSTISGPESHLAALVEILQKAMVECRPLVNAVAEKTRVACCATDCKWNGCRINEPCSCHLRRVELAEVDGVVACRDYQKATETPAAAVFDNYKDFAAAGMVVPPAEE